MHASTSPEARHYMLAPPPGKDHGPSLCGHTTGVTVIMPPNVTCEVCSEILTLRRWKAEALPVMDGLQELGKALDLPIGERITGPAAIETVNALKAWLP